MIRSGTIACGFSLLLGGSALAQVTQRASLSWVGAQGDSDSVLASLSADGRWVAFFSGAPLALGDVNGFPDVFVRDRLYTNALADVFVRDRQLGLTERVSIDTVGVQANNFSGSPSISADGRYVAFDSMASNLASGDTNVVSDVYVRDRQSGLTERVSLSSGGVQPNSYAANASISADGSCVAFQSLASNLVGGDTNGCQDIFVHDRFGGAISTTVCNPGVGSVMQCPCSNPAGGPGGCDNSSATGGAILSAAGDTRLASDSLVFTTSGQLPTTASVLVQGTALIASGVIYGQGVRCVAGTLRRLAVKGASAGSITVPDFGAGEPSISVLSALLGDTILAGQSRWYLVLYRDGIVLAGCPPASSFNVTQTVEIVWLP